MVRSKWYPTETITDAENCTSSYAQAGILLHNLKQAAKNVGR